MSSSFEVADVINKFYNQGFRKTIPVYKQRTLTALQQCRTSALGGHVDQCDSCGLLKISYNSCRNRNCPKCQGLEKEMWIIQREEELLPVSYFHVVFTIPHQLNGLCLHNPRFMYNLLFESAWYVLKTFGDDPKWLAAKSAATMILHTWGQNLSLHPHIHCIVPSGGLRKDGAWQNAKKGSATFLYPILAMNHVYKAYLLKKMRLHLEAGELSLPKNFPMGQNYYNWKESLYQKGWVIYAKPPFGKVANVVKYLGRYSHRVAISNQRIAKISDNNVNFHYKDYNDGANRKVMALSGIEFLRRFCMHILPPRFRKIRHYGFLANASKKKSLTVARVALKQEQTKALSRAQRKQLAKNRIFGNQANLCPCCNKGTMLIMECFPKNKDPPILNETHAIIQCE